MGCDSSSGVASPKTPEEMAKENLKTINRAIRQLDKEIKNLNTAEAKALKDIKALAQKNQHGPAKVLAK